MISFSKNCSLIGLLFFVCACAGSKSGSDSSLGKKDDVEASDESVQGFFTYPLSQNPITLRKLDRKRVQKVVDRLDEANRDDLKVAYADLSAMIIGQRLLGAPLSKILGYAKKLSEVGFEIGMKETITQDIQLEIGLAAIQNKNYDMADYYLDPLCVSKSPKIKASALNAKGLIAKSEGLISEAVQFWQEAAKAHPEMSAAFLNMGYVSLSYAGYESAQSYLSKVEGDSFAASGLSDAKRLGMQNDAAKASCSTLLDKLDNHGPTIFNCGLLYLQNFGDKKQGKKLITQAMKLKPLPNQWLDKGDTALSSAR